MVSNMIVWFVVGAAALYAGYRLIMRPSSGCACHSAPSGGSGCGCSRPALPGQEPKSGCCGGKKNDSGSGCGCGDKKKDESADKKACGCGK